MHALDDLALLTTALALIMLSVTFRSQISAQSHGDRTCCNFRQTREDDQPCHISSASEPCSQRERYRQPIGHADYNIAYEISRREMSLNVQNIRMPCPATWWLVIK